VDHRTPPPAEAGATILRISDVLEYEVVDLAGERLGRVSDVRVVQDGPIVRGLQARFRVDALIVGRAGLAERLGYMRGRVDGPWILKALFSRIERLAHTVPIEAIDSWDDDKRTIRVRREMLDVSARRQELGQA
jgi:hypothetical protein